jgi:hypothetical protein
VRTSAFLTTALAAAVFATPVALAPTLVSPAAAATPTVYGGIWTVDTGANSVSEYAPSAHGAATATTVISGLATGLDGPTAVAVGTEGVVYVVNTDGDSITEYAKGATGNATPIRTIGGARTGLDGPSGISLVQGQIWVTDPASNLVEAFTATASGNVLPAETISGKKTKLDHPTAIAADFLFISVLNTPTVGRPSITVYLPFPTYGNIAPFGAMKGTSKTLLSPTAIATSPEGLTYVNDTADNSISRVVPFLSAFTDRVPTLPGIKGAKTGLNDPVGLGVDATGHLLVTNAGDHSVRVFDSHAKGNTAPVRTITAVGSDDGSPAAVAVFGARPGAPTDLHATVHGNSATLSWKPPAVTGGGILGYEVIRTGGGVNELVDTESDAETTKTTMTVHDLPAGRSSLFRVVAVNAFGVSRGSNLAHVFVKPAPSAPRQVSVVATSHRLTVDWKRPKSHGGSHITHYLVAYSTGPCGDGFSSGATSVSSSSGGSVGTVPLITSPRATPRCSVFFHRVGAKRHQVTLKHLVPGKRYTVVVAARNNSGYGKVSKSVKIKTLK